jgi:hypothetical protein
MWKPSRWKRRSFSAVSHRYDKDLTVISVVEEFANYLSRPYCPRNRIVSLDVVKIKEKRQARRFRDDSPYATSEIRRDAITIANSVNLSDVF